MLQSDDKAQKLTVELQKLYEQHELMGMTLLLIEEGNITYHQNFGLADWERKRPITDSTLFRVASISKSITAAAILQLFEQGKLDLDTDVSQYLGWKLRNPKHPQIPITLRLLMNHRSSIQDGGGYGQFSGKMLTESNETRSLS